MMHLPCPMLKGPAHLLSLARQCFIHVMQGLLLKKKVQQRHCNPYSASGVDNFTRHHLLGVKVSIHVKGFGQFILFELLTGVLEHQLIDSFWFGDVFRTGKGRKARLKKLEVFPPVCFRKFS